MNIELHQAKSQLQQAKETCEEFRFFATDTILGLAARADARDDLVQEVMATGMSNAEASAEFANEIREMRELHDSAVEMMARADAKLWTAKDRVERLAHALHGR